MTTSLEHLTTAAVAYTEEDRPALPVPERHSSLGALPWWLVSSVVHAVLIFLTMFIVISRPGQEDSTLNLVRAEFTKPPPEKNRDPKI